MKIPDIARTASIVLVGVMMSACSGDPNKPATVDEQRAAMHHAPPSADELKQAMSRVHFKTPGSNSIQTPPSGAVPPAAGKTGP